MAKKKSNSSNKRGFLKRVHKLTENDIFTSIAVASILLNVLFLITIFVLSSTDTFDRSMYSSVKSRYCRNVSGVERRASELGSESDALSEWQINCNSSEFRPYFNEAVEKFKASQSTDSN